MPSSQGFTSRRAEWSISLERSVPRSAARRLSGVDLIVGFCLASAAGFAWLWLAMGPMAGAGMDMAAMAGIETPVWSALYLLPAFVMWVLMMVAMMLPSAAPMILLHARVLRQSRPERWRSETALFVLAYLAVWSLFSAAAAIAQAVLVAAELVSALTLSIGSGTAAAILLILAAAYQLSPLKRTCLRECRSPLHFVMRYSRPGPAGALRLGFIHGLHCLGCCWALMLVLFVGGAMNLLWAAALAALVIFEKYAPSAAFSRVIAGLLAAGAVALLAAG